jgi:hypothetical protein
MCTVVAYNPTTGQRYSGSSLDPQSLATIYFGLYEKREVARPPSSNVELISSPKHGKVKVYEASSEYGYIPDPGYVGDDRLVFRVNVDGAPLRLVYLLKVTKMSVDAEGVHDVLCKGTGTFWKISLNPDDPNTGAVPSRL